MRDPLDTLASLGRRRPRSVLGVFLALALVCAGLSLTLTPSSNLDTLVSSGSADYRATQTDAQQFGGAAVAVLVREPLQTLVGSKDLGVLSELEACLAGQRVDASPTLGAFVPVPAARAIPYGGRQSPCGHLMSGHYAQVVYGPSTFLNQAVIAVNKQIRTLTSSVRAAVAAKEAEARALARRQHLSAAQTAQLVQATASSEQSIQIQSLEKLALSSGLLADGGLPAIDNTQFIDTVVFDATRGAYVPKARFSYLFPTSDSALVQVRLAPNLSSAQTAAAIHWIRAAVAMPMFGLSGGGRYLVSGEPVILNDLSSSLSGQIALLLIGAVVVMAVVLLAIFRRRRRLLPLALALAAAAITFGLCAIAGGTLTMASIAVLPILIGLAVDYGIQFQSGASGAPTIAAAALATATGFLVLLLSPVPMVRGFGLLLVLGVAVAFVIVLCAGSAALVVAVPDPVRRGAPAAALRGAGEILLAPARAMGRALTPVARGGARGLRRIAAPVGASARGAREIVAGARRPGAAANRGGAEAQMGGGGRIAAALGVALARPRTVLALGLVLAIAGWVADTQTPVQSDVTRLVPRNLPALRDLTSFEQTTGESGELDVLVHGRDVATPATIAWMVSYEKAVTSHFGYVEANGCKAAGTRICPALSLPDLFSSGASTAAGSGAAAQLSQSEIDTLLAAVPPYFSQAVINHNRTYAALAFGIRLMPLTTQIAMIRYMRGHLHPPPGISARLAGLPVLAADADASLSSSPRRLLTLVAGLCAVAVMLLALFREPRRALVPLVPIALATGWSALIVWTLGIALNPMSATLGALVIAISTEFSVLLAERFRRERSAGQSPAQALTSAYRSTGKAVVASGVTAIAGFAVLILSDVTMLRDFGWVTLVDMTVSLIGVLAVLPAVLALADAGERAARRRPARVVSPRARRQRVTA